MIDGGVSESIDVVDVAIDSSLIWLIFFLPLSLLQIHTYKILMRTSAISTKVNTLKLMKMPREAPICTNKSLKPIFGVSLTYSYSMLEVNAKANKQRLIEIV